MTAFIKAHGLGNDFVIIDRRAHPGLTLSAPQIAAIADRHRGVGCDQLALLDEGGEESDVTVSFFNADGGESGACGNASRCIGWLEMQRTGHTEARLKTRDRLLVTRHAGEERVTVDMNPPRLAWQDIPLATAVDTRQLPLELDPLHSPVAVSMGNPHAVFFVPDADAVDLHRLGPELEHHSLFPERANIGIATVENRGHIRLRVWERGAGETQACGTGACAAQVAARRLGLTDAEVKVTLPGGDLSIRWDGSEDDSRHSVWMTGPVAISFTGVLAASLL